MKTVLEIIGKLRIGGAEKVAYEIGMNAPSDYEVHYVVFENEIGEYENILVEKGCKIFHIPSPNENYILFINNISDLIIKYKYSVIHAHTMFNSGWAMYLGYKYKVPVRITHSHSKMDPAAKNFIKKAYNLFMKYLIHMYATDFVGCGKAAGEFMFGKSFFNKKGVVLLNGIDTKKFAFNCSEREELRNKLGLDNNFVIGHVGRLSKVKNQSFLIEIMPEILKKVPNAKLVLVGDGEDREKLEKLTEQYNLTKEVLFMGSVLDVYNYINVFDVFAFPSFNEGTPLSLIENQINGLPCVISDRIPKDTQVTDLISVCSLEDKNKWIKTICTKKRVNSELYAQKVKEMGFDISDMINTVYGIFDRKK